MTDLLAASFWAVVLLALLMTPLVGLAWLARWRWRREYGWTLDTQALYPSLAGSGALLGIALIYQVIDAPYAGWQIGADWPLLSREGSFQCLSYLFPLGGVTVWLVTRDLATIGLPKNRPSPERLLHSIVLLAILGFTMLVPWFLFLIAASGLAGGQPDSASLFFQFPTRARILMAAVVALSGLLIGTGLLRGFSCLWDPLWRREMEP